MSGPRTTCDAVRVVPSLSPIIRHSGCKACATRPTSPVAIAAINAVTAASCSASGTGAGVESTCLRAREASCRAEAVLTSRMEATSSKGTEKPSCNTNATRCGGSERVQDHQRGEPGVLGANDDLERIGRQRSPGRDVACGDYGLWKPLSDIRFPPRSSRFQPVETDPRHDRGEPGSKILDGLGVGRREPDPTFLYRILGVGDTARHPVADCQQMGAMGLKVLRERNSAHDQKSVGRASEREPILPSLPTVVSIS